MSSTLFGSKRSRKPHLLENNDLGGEVKDLRADIDEAFVSLEAGGGVAIVPVVVQEFTNPEAADDDWFKASFATAATPNVGSTFTNATIPSLIPRSITISRTADVASYTTDPIVLTGTKLVAGVAVPVELTFTPADADGGDVIESDEDDGFSTITGYDFPAQVDANGAFKIGFGAAIVLSYAVKSRAGLVAVIRQVVAGAVVTTGTFVGAKYTPAAPPDLSKDYAVYYERV